MSQLHTEEIQSIEEQVKKSYESAHNVVFGTIVVVLSWKYIVGPSVVRALLLTAGINEGGHYKRYFGSERSACAALDCWHKRRWPLQMAFFSPLSFFRLIANSPIRGCRRNSNLCMWS